MGLQPVKCNTMQLTRKCAEKVIAGYTLEDTFFQKVDKIKYLEITITVDLRWNTHVSNICTKANRNLGFLRRNLYSCPQDVKRGRTGAFSPGVWQFCLDTQDVVLQEELESLNGGAARFVQETTTMKLGV